MGLLTSPGKCRDYLQSKTLGIYFQLYSGGLKCGVGSERVQQPELGLLQDCVNIDGDTKGLPESLLDGGGDDDHPKPSNALLVKAN